MTPSEHRTAVLLDEHPLWLEGVEQVLARIGIEVIGKATAPEHALALIEEHRPSLFVTGNEMEDGGRWTASSASRSRSSGRRSSR